MKTLMIFAAVLLVGKAAKVPQVSSDQITAPVPLNVLASTTDVATDIINAMVVEISKEHVQAPDITVITQPQEEEMVTVEQHDPVNPTTITIVTSMAEKISKYHVQAPEVVMTTVETDHFNPTTVTLDTSLDTINPCDLLCTKFEFDPVCATNGLCLHQFPNQCILDTYNCKHPSTKFSATKDQRCKMHWLTKCDESEMI